tara:strand:+ start:27 stop:1070 length:1044 start_codon:yes stop_codon:yes gene_type:complete
LKKEFSGKITKEVKLRLERSSNWKKTRFKNLVKTKIDINLFNLPGLLYRQFFKTKGRTPSSPIPIKPIDLSFFDDDPESFKFIWFGHSAVLLNIGGKIIFIDPMMGHNASPIAPFSVKRFSTQVLNVLDELPNVDLLLLSHDHYDHLDFSSIQKLKGRVQNYWVSLGSKRHLVEWGVHDEKVVEFDWWDSLLFDNIEITFTPSRHSGGRILRDRDKTLWGGWAIKSKIGSVYFSGDGGYGSHFKTIGDKLGPFDFGFMECGQYNELWRQIHMFPEESVQAAQDSRISEIIPVHWAGFALALHHWKSPVNDFILCANKKKCNWSVPELGQVITKSTSGKQVRWWDNLA